MNKLKLSLIFLLAFGSACYESTEEKDNQSTPLRKTSTPIVNSTANNSVVNNSNNSNNSVVSNNNAPVSNNQTTQNTNSSEIKSGGFNGNLPAGFVTPTDSVGKRLLREYGSVFVARGGTTPPSTVIYKDESAVSAFQSSVSKSSEKFGSFTIELQSAAMTGLKNAIAEAKQSNLTITPNGADAAKRTYDGTVANWKSRVEPGLVHWVKKGKISQAEATRIKSLSTFEQVTEILRLEEKQIYFAKSLDKTILQSVAAPGTSQHISMLALDIKENGNAKVREIMAKHGWFQTIVTDLPHFTFLGVKESELPGLGLKQKSDAGRTYWIPDI